MMPNGLKLSDRGRKVTPEYNKKAPSGLCSLERVVRRVDARVAAERPEDCSGLF